MCAQLTYVTSWFDIKAINLYVPLVTLECHTSLNAVILISVILYMK